MKVLEIIVFEKVLQILPSELSKAFVAQIWTVAYRCLIQNHAYCEAFKNFPFVSAEAKPQILVPQNEIC